jgi:RHS repeat-associated protein
LVDNLNYTYNANSNKIQKVDDASSETASFSDVAGNDYEYWLDGSLKKDNNKGITQIDYNYLKLPQKIFLTNNRWIEYEYDATGVKLKKILSTGKVTDYEEDEIYENNVLYQTSHDEGRIVNGVFEFDIKDHLGNTRVSFKDNNGTAQMTQANHTGAWGEILPTLSYINTPKVNNFTYSTYEKEDDFGIGVFDAHARVYDPTVPRFWSIDEMAEKNQQFSPYSYAANNPILYTDPDGRDIVISYEEQNKRGKTVTRTINYTPGMKLQGPEGVQQTITALNFIAKNGGDYLSKIASADYFRWTVAVDANQTASMVFEPLQDANGIPVKSSDGKYDAYTPWSPNGGYVDEKNNTHSPVSALQHESVHANLRFEEATALNNATTPQDKRNAENWVRKRDEWSASPTGITGYMNNEEYYVTRKEAAFQQKYLGETPRPNHRGDPYRTTGPFSRTPANGVVPKFRPRR